MTLAPGEHERQYEFMMAPFEKWALPRLARMLPGWVMPDHLTLLGIFSATGIAAAYVATNRNPDWFWVASALIAVHWFADSLDGTLARVRKTERPRYGFYLDHITDAYSTAVVGIGLGFSSVIHLSVGVALAILYLVMSINVYLETHIYRKFQFGYGRVGPTEGRVLLIVLSVVAVLTGPVSVPAFGYPVTLFDVVGLLLAISMAGLLAARVISNLRHLGRLEPPGVVRAD